MKTIYFSGCMCTLLAFFSMAAFSQTTVVVNNTPGVKADYASLQTAVDNVAPGTLILLQPGVTTYGDVVIKKMVSIIGAGYFLGQNPAPNTQASLQSSIVDRIFFDSLSNGSYITGLSVSGEVSTGMACRFGFEKTSNITISRCYITRPGHPYPIYSICRLSSAITFKQCYFQGGVNLYVLQTDQSTGIEFHNNIFDSQVLILPFEVLTNYAASVLFQNNIMFSLYNAGANPSAVTFINNIIFQNVTGSGSATIDAVAALNNVTNVAFSVAGPNITNAVYANVFVLNSDPAIIPSQDARFKLKAGSPALGYGQSSVDCGAFGGIADAKYELSGIAEFVPNIFSLQVPTVGTATGGLPVRIKVRANK